jgi:hypothetical protein
LNQGTDLPEAGRPESPRASRLPPLFARPERGCPNLFHLDDQPFGRLADVEGLDVGPGDPDSLFPS